jgi:hypothetical protein
MGFMNWVCYRTHAAVAVVEVCPVDCQSNAARPDLATPRLCDVLFSAEHIGAETNYPKQAFYFHRGLGFSSNAVQDGVLQDGVTLIVDVIV